MTKSRILGAILYENFELLDYYGPLEMFGNLGRDFKIVTVAEKYGSVKSVQGPSTVVDVDFANAPDLDFILLPGGIGTNTELANPIMLDFLKERAANAEVVMSVCSGSAILAKAGLLDGKKATSNKLFFSMASEQSDKVTWETEARWVEDGNTFTSSGVSAGTDMALGVIAKFYGTEKAQEIAVMTEYEWHSDAGKDPFSQYLNQGDIAQYMEALGIDISG